jgi:beta-mannan synthase
MAGVALPGWGTTVPAYRGDAAAAAVWQQLKSPVVVPLLRLSVVLCLAMSVMLFAEKVYLAAAVLATRLLGRRPERRYRWEPIRDVGDLEDGGGDDGGSAAAVYPMVLVQIPMYNEREVSDRVSCDRYTADTGRKADGAAAVDRGLRPGS